MIAICEGPGSSTTTSNLDLDDCLWNDGGQLKAGNEYVLDHFKHLSVYVFHSLTHTLLVANFTKHVGSVGFISSIMSS
jgi:hypothetical protein